MYYNGVLVYTTEYRSILIPKINNAQNIVMSMVETILVAGATGTVGSEVIKQLSSATRDSNIKAAIHSAERAKRVKYGMVEPIQIDYYKPNGMCIF
jgi:NADPH-dependent curcumin reductase CurA